MLHPTATVLRVLRNECIPISLLPSTYDIEAYSHAILCPEGLTNVNALSPFRTCKRCRRYLESSSLRQPPFALGIFLHYARDRLPRHVADAFDTASPFDLSLISRCQSSTVTHHFVRRGAHGRYVPEESSQRFNRGNLAIFPQDVGSLRNVLPPDVRDTICVLFTGGGTKPTVESLRKFGPVLVCKSKVETMIKFLVENNEWYQSDGVRYSERNMQTLLPHDDDNSDFGLLGCLQVEHSPEGKGSEIRESDWNEIQNDIVMTM
ncbi:hypothetical protein JVU11DRAFT_9262 [Chiua virens]|nr:hypothetical protein JVU11DRAFT_9262 [Chiua virens]